jgi:hypothetical protein
VSRGTPGGSAVPFERRGPGRQKRRLAVLNRQPEFWIYFIVGLILIVVFSHQQFNQRSWQNESNLIQQLTPSQIIRRSTYYAAYALYLGLIVSVYFTLCVSEHALEVAMTVLKLLASSLPAPETVGGLVNQTGGVGEADVVSEVDPQRHASTAQYPILVSLWMGALMRFPYVSRVEAWLRGFSHWIFGIPTVQVKLLDRMLSTSVDLNSLEADLERDDVGEPYSARAARYADACAQALGVTFGKQVFRDRLGVIFAFKVWVAERRIWPTDGLAVHSETLAPLKSRVLDEIAVLEKELELLSSRTVAGDGDPVPENKLREELWEYRVKDVNRVWRDVCSVMALFHPNSNLPDKRLPTARSLIAFLKTANSPNDVWHAQRNLALIAIVLGALEMALMGGLFALALQFAVPDIYAANPDAAVFDDMAQAREWMVTGLLAYGTATYVGMYQRTILARCGMWRNVFDEQIVPFDQWAKLAARCFVWVVVLYAIYFFVVQVMVPLEELRVVMNSFPETLWRDVKEIIPFGIIAALHGTMMAVLMDLRRQELEGHIWKRLVAFHVAMLAVTGCAIGYYISNVRGVPVEAMYVRLVMNSLAPAGMALIAGLTLVSGKRRTIAIAHGPVTAQPELRVAA